MSPPKKNSTTVPIADQSSSAAVKLAVAVPPILTEVKINKFDDDDGGPPDDGGPLEQIIIDVADNGCMVRFIDIFGDSDRIIVKDTDELLSLLRKRMP